MTLKEVEKYKKLSGDNDQKTTIPKMISFLDGYEVGCNKTIDMVLEIIDNYTAFRCKGGSDVFEAVILRPHDMKNAIETLKGGRDN